MFNNAHGKMLVFGLFEQKPIILSQCAYRGVVFRQSLNRLLERPPSAQLSRAHTGCHSFIGITKFWALALLTIKCYKQTYGLIIERPLIYISI